MILPLLLIFVYFVFCNNSKFGTNDFFGKILLICPLLFAQWLDDCLSLLKGLKELDFLAQSSRFHLDNLQIIMIFNCSVMILLCLSLFIFGLFKHKCYLGSNKYMWKISIGFCYLNSHLERESPPITTLTRLLPRFCPRFSMLPFLIQLGSFPDPLKYFFYPYPTKLCKAFGFWSGCATLIRRTWFQQNNNKTYGLAHLGEFENMNMFGTNFLGARVVVIWESTEHRLEKYSNCSQCYYG